MGVALGTAVPSFLTGGFQPSGLKPSGGFFIKNEPIKFTIKNKTPKIANVSNTPNFPINASATGVNTSPPNPSAETIIPVIKPLLDGFNKKLAPLQKLINGIYPEHMVYLKSAGICGQSDLVEVVDDTVHITDYKTNKEIKKESFVSWDGISKKMLGPLRHLDDCNLNHYTLQLSIYMYIILKHNPRLKPGKMYLDHIVFEDLGLDDSGNKIHQLDLHGHPLIKEVVKYELPYLKAEVISIINTMKE